MNTVIDWSNRSELNAKRANGGKSCPNCGAPISSERGRFERCSIAGMFDNTENCIDFLDTTRIKGRQVIKVRNYSRQICEVFEEILDRYDMRIPDDFRTGDESESPLFGAEWDEAMSQITDILEDLLEELEKKPDAVLNYEEY